MTQPASSASDDNSDNDDYETVVDEDGVYEEIPELDSGTSQDTVCQAASLYLHPFIADPGHENTQAAYNDGQGAGDTRTVYNTPFTYLTHRITAVARFPQLSYNCLILRVCSRWIIFQ